MPEPCPLFSHMLTIHFVRLKAVSKGDVSLVSSLASPASELGQGSMDEVPEPAKKSESDPSDADSFHSKDADAASGDAMAPAPQLSNSDAMEVTWTTFGECLLLDKIDT